MRIVVLLCVALVLLVVIPMHSSAPSLHSSHFLPVFGGHVTTSHL